METNEAIELLHSLQKVDPPPFLFTRIEARLEQRRAVPRNWVLAAIVGACAIVVLNVTVLRLRTGGQTDDVASLANGMGVNDSNQLYQ